MQVKASRVKMTLVSRRSRYRSGVRFFSRGVDAEGRHVSNFVETEQVVATRRGVTSHVSILIY
jgi:hypothetical protein